MVPGDLEIVNEATERLRPQALRGMTMHRNLLARAVRHFELRRGFASRSVPKNFSRLRSSLYLGSGRDGSGPDLLEPHQLNATVCRASQVIQQVRVPLEERAQILHRLGFCGALCNRADFGEKAIQPLSPARSVVIASSTAPPKSLVALKDTVTPSGEAAQAA